MRRVWWPALLTAWACVTPVPPPAEPAPPPAPPPISVPEGCLASLAGAWVHEEDPSYRYLATDDGGALELLVTRVSVADAGFQPRRFRPDAGAPPTAAGAPSKKRPAPDAGVAPPPDAGPEPEDAGTPHLIVVTLERTPGGFLGHGETTLQHPAGHACVVRFATKVLSCADGGLLLETDSAAALGDACQPPARPQGIAREQHRLVRLPLP